MAVPQLLSPQPSGFEAVRGPHSARQPFRMIATGVAGAVALMALIAVAFSGSAHRTELGMGSDEVMKGWTDGMYPPGATFPAGYHFGNDNVFGKHSKFGAGDTFGDDNVFGKDTRFGAGSSFGDSNDFGKEQYFAPGSEIGEKNTIGGYSTFGEGIKLGQKNLVGRFSHFDKRDNLGKRNTYGRNDEFGRRDKVGAFSQFGPGSVFGGDMMFGKEEEFGSDNTWSPERQTFGGHDIFARRDWGLRTKDLPRSDKAAWKLAKSMDPDYKPEHDIIIKSIALKSIDKKRSRSSNGKEAEVLRAIEQADKKANSVKSALEKVAKAFEQRK